MADPFAIAGCIVGGIGCVLGVAKWLYDRDKSRRDERHDGKEDAVALATVQANLVEKIHANDTAARDRDNACDKRVTIMAEKIDALAIKIDAFVDSSDTRFRRLEDHREAGADRIATIMATQGKILEELVHIVSSDHHDAKPHIRLGKNGTR